MNFKNLTRGIFTFLSLFYTNLFFSQNQLSNAREGENIQYCLQHVIHNQQMQNQEYATQFFQDQANLKLIEEQIKNNPELQRGTVYKIPIVFHVLHNGGPENISREQILDGLRIMNRDWRKLNADTTSVVADFTDRIADIEIEFVLATKAPNGACFNGITRTQSPLSFVTSNTQGQSQVNAIISGNDVYNAQWPGNKYLNVFICGDIGGAAGYTTQPSNWSGTAMTNGIWVLHDYVGSIGTGSDGRDRTLTHEAGHWLNLPHTWGDSNEPGLASNCNTDDGISDTPNTRGSTSCNLNENFCGPRANVQNYMDYSYCNHMFTEGQKTVMRAAILSSTGGRNNVWQAANLAATGADGILTLCEADFTTDKNTICAGDNIQFSDLSYNAVTAWNWNFGAGIADAIDIPNPIVTFNTPGIYPVTLNATHNGTTLTKTANIKVLSQSEPIAFMEGFENQTTLVDNTKWEITNPQNNQAFSIVNGTALSGSKSIKLENFVQAADSEDELIASPVDLSGISTNVTLSFRYSYRKKATTNNEKLQLYGSKDCGATWALLKNVSGTQLSSTVQTTAWTPNNASHWTTVHVTNIFSTYWVENFRYKFKFTSDGGNNIYLDNINIYEGAASEELVLLDSDNDGQTNDVDADDDNDGIIDTEDAYPYDPFNIASINEKQNEKTSINIYPNPTDKDFVVEFVAKNYGKTIIQLLNPLGELVQERTINANPGNNMVFLESNELSNGIYFLRVNVDGKSTTNKITFK